MRKGVKYKCCFEYSNSSIKYQYFILELEYENE